MVHTLVRRLKADGVCIFLINPPHARRVRPVGLPQSDENGRVVGTYRTAELSEGEALAMIIGGKPVTRVA